MDWKKALGHVAPWIATALSGVAGPGIAGAAAAALGKALGVEDAGLDVLEAKVPTLTAEQLGAIRAGEQQFQKDMRAIDVDLERIAAGDRASARDREVKTRDWVPATLAMLTLIVYGLEQWYVFTHQVPETSRDLVVAGLKTTEALLLFVFGYYFGSSVGSQRKDATIGEAARRR